MRVSRTRILQSKAEMKTRCRSGCPGPPADPVKRRCAVGEKRDVSDSLIYRRASVNRRATARRAAFTVYRLHYFLALSILWAVLGQSQYTKARAHRSFAQPHTSRVVGLGGRTRMTQATDGDARRRAETRRPPLLLCPLDAREVRRGQAVSPPQTHTMIHEHASPSGPASLCDPRPRAAALSAVHGIRGTRVPSSPLHAQMPRPHKKRPRPRSGLLLAAVARASPVGPALLSAERAPRFVASRARPGRVVSPSPRPRPRRQ